MIQSHGDVGRSPCEIVAIAQWPLSKIASHWLERHNRDVEEPSALYGRDLHPKLVHSIQREARDTRVES